LDVELFRLITSCLVMVAACGDDVTTPPLDAGAPDASPDATVPIAAPPNIPWLESGVPPLELTPCPEGWREVTDELGVTTCDPYPDAGPSDCPFGEAHFVGEPGCRPIGDPCPAGDWADELPSDDTVVFVRAGATGGDGSRAAPYGSLSEVPWALHGSGWTIALARGTYRGTLSLRAGLRIVGACAAETVLEGVPTTATAVVTVEEVGEPPVLRNLAIANAPQSAISVTGARHGISLEGVLIENVTETGANAAEGATIQATDLVIRGTRTNRDLFGRGLNASTGASIEATRLVVAEHHDLGIFVNGSGTTITLTDAIVSDNRGAPNGTGGAGVVVQAGARVEATRLLLSNNRSNGLFAALAESSVTLTDVVVRDTRPEDSGNGGVGLFFQDGAQLEATRLHVSNNSEVGVVALGDATVTLTDAVIRDTQLIRTGVGGVGLMATGGRVTATRLLLSRNHSTALTVTRLRGEATVVDVMIHDTQPRDADGKGGYAFNVQNGGRLDASRLVISECRDVAGATKYEDSTVILTDAVVRDTRPRELDGAAGLGLVAQEGARLEATRVIVSGSHDAAIFAEAAGASITATDVLIRDTEPRANDMTNGYGAVAQSGAHFDATRLHLEGAYAAGIMAITGGVFDGREVVVSRVMPAACDCPGRASGYGVTAWGGRVTLADFRISDAATCGVFIAPEMIHDSHMDLVSGVVEGSAIGACVQVDGYDLARISQDVVYRDNEANIDATSLPVPEPIELEL